MKNSNFKTGTMVKGSDLNGCVLCKIISEDMCMRDFQYKIGMNEDTNPLATEGSCQTGLHFSFVQDILGYLNYGTGLAIVSIPDDEDVYVDDGKLRSHRLEIREIMSLMERNTWEYLYEHGADIAIKDNFAVKWAAMGGYPEIVKYLYEHGADITVDNNFSVRYAAMTGNLEMVKCLNECGADIAAADNQPVISAAMNGDLEMVKYLHEHGADVTARNNFLILYAAEEGHLELVKYLYENEPDVAAEYNRARRWAAEKGHVGVAEYLKTHKK